MYGAFEGQKVSSGSSVAIVNAEKSRLGLIVRKTGHTQTYRMR